MKVIYGLGPTKLEFSYPVIAIGIFDGVHKGHQELIKKLIVCAKKRHGQAIVLTFHPHPVHVLHPEIYLPFITSLPYRLKLLEELLGSTLLPLKVACLMFLNMEWASWQH